MAFDPDKYLAEKGLMPTAAPAAAFDPDKYLAEKTAQPMTAVTEMAASAGQVPTDDISKTESFLRAAVQVPTLGFADEIAGGAEALGDIATTDSNLSDLGKLYETYRDMQRRKDKAAQAANPKTSLAGSLAGGVATAFIPGLNAASLEGAMAAGAVTGLGGSEAKVLDGEIAPALKDIAMGGAIGGVGQQVGSKIGQLFSKSANAVGKAGEKQLEKAAEGAYSTLNPSVKEMTELQNVIRSGADFDTSLPELVKKYTFGNGGAKKTVEEVSKRIDEIENLKSPILDQAETALEALSPESAAKLSGFNLNSQMDDLVTRTVQRQKGLNSVEKLQLQDDLRSYLKDFTNPSMGMPSLDDAGQIVDAARQSTNFSSMRQLDSVKKALGEDLSDRGFAQAQAIADGTISPRNKAQLEATREAYDIVKNHIIDIGDTVGGDLGSKIRNLNNEESILIGLRDTAKKAAATDAKGSPGLGVGGGMAIAVGSEIGRNLGGLPGAIVGGALGYGAKKGIEATTGQGIDKLATLAGSAARDRAGKLLSKFGGTLKNSEGAAAPILGKAEQAIMGGTEPGKGAGAAINSALRNPFATKDGDNNGNLAAYDDASLDGVGMALANSDNKQLQSYGQNLQKALQSGNRQSKNAAVFLIMQSPQARKQLGLTTKQK